MQHKLFLLLVPLLTVAIVGLGLRTGAKDEVEAAIVHGAPLPKGGGRLAWTLSTFREASGVRDVLVTPFHATFHGAGEAVVLDGTTNEEGTAELAATLPGLQHGDPLSIEITGTGGVVLAAGQVAWADVIRSETRVLVHPTVREGELDVIVSAWGARLPAAHEGVLWVRADDHASGHPAHLVRVDIEPDPALTIIDPFRAACTDVAGTIRVIANMHVAPSDLRVTDEHGKTGRFYGSLPIAPAALWVDVPDRAPAGPASFTITAPNTHKFAYVEVDDEAGRAFGAQVALVSDALDPFPHARVTTPPLAPGLHWIVVSGEPEGAEALAGATRAIPLRVDAPAECDEPFSGRTPTALPRFVALDGFARARIPAQGRKRIGRKIILGAVATGLTLELLLLASALRKKPGFAAHEEQPKEPARSRAFDAIALLMLSALGFLLLFALLESQTR
ncbi:hypothetical protein BH09MYX1_BH09MYX1_02510 [soil metagenome]